VNARLYISGHSAGGHLAAMMLTRSWQDVEISGTQIQHSTGLYLVVVVCWFMYMYIGRSTKGVLEVFLPPEGLPCSLIYFSKIFSVVHVYIVVYPLFKIVNPPDNNPISTSDVIPCSYTPII